MNAQHVLAHIAAYRELETRERTRVDQHLSSCQSCAQAFAQAQQVDTLLAGLPRLQATTAQDQVLRQRLAATARRPQWPGWLRLPNRQPQWARVIFVVLVVTLLSTTGVVAAQSLPDSPLYTLKLAAEQARSLVTVDPAAQADWQLTLARTRLDEVTTLVTRGQVPSAETLSRLSWQFDQAVTAAARAPAADTYRLLSAADELNGLAMLRINAWLRALPPSVQPALAQTLAGVQNNQAQVLEGLADPEQFRLPTTPSTATPTPTGTATPAALPAAEATSTPTPRATAETQVTDQPTDAPAFPPTATPEPTATATRVQPTPTASTQPVASPTPRPTRTRRFRPTPTAVVTPLATVEPLPTRVPRITRTPRVWPTPTAVTTSGATIEPLPTRWPRPTRTPAVWPTPTPADSVTPEVTAAVTPPRRTPRWIPPRRR